MTGFWEGRFRDSPTGPVAATTEGYQVSDGRRPPLQDAGAGEVVGVEGDGEGVAEGGGGGVFFGAGDAAVAVGELDAAGAVAEDFNHGAARFDLVGVGHGQKKDDGRSEKEEGLTGTSTFSLPPSVAGR